MEKNKITVEVALALPDTQYLYRFTLPEKSTVSDAVASTDLAEKYPEIVQQQLFARRGKRISPNAMLENNDRIDICRPIKIDPKTARILRAEKQKGWAFRQPEISHGEHQDTEC